LVEGRVLEALKGLEALPPVVRAERIVNAHSDHSARERVIALVANAVAADQTELRQRAERGELLTEVEQLRLRLIEAEAAERIEQAQPVEAEQADAAGIEQSALQEAERRIASLEDEIKYLRGVKPRQLPPPNAKAMAPVKPAEPVKSAAPAKPADAWNGPQDGPPSWLRPVPQVAPEDRPPAAPPQTRSGDETKAAMDRVNSDRSAFYQHLGLATHSEPWRDYVGADGDISMRPRGGWGFP
jgi:hypothetical protein